MALKPAFDYGSRDFSNIKRDLLRRAERIAPLWTERDPSDFGMLMVDLWSYMGDVIHYYIDRVSQEAFIQTATQRESVLSFANLYDYTPNFRTSAEATIYMHNSSSASVSVPSNTKFRVMYNDTFYNFHTPLETVLPANTSTFVKVLEGKRIENEVLTSSANGEPSQSYTIRNTKIAPTSIRVFTGKGDAMEEWFRYKSVSEIPIGMPGYAVSITPESEVQILFGDRANGRIPPSTTLITVSYTESSGSTGNIPSNNPTFFEGTPPDPSLVLLEMSAATGGSNGDTVESLRSSLQRIVRSQDRAVTLKDYEDLTLSVNGVYDAVVQYVPNSGSASSGSASSTIIVTPVPLITDYVNETRMSVPISAQMQSDIQSLLEEKGMVGIGIQVEEELQLIPANMEIQIIINPKYVTNWVVGDVQSSINQLFSFTNVKIGKIIPQSEIIRAALNVNGVESVYLTRFDFTNNETTFVYEEDMPANALVRRGDVTIDPIGGINTSS